MAEVADGGNAAETGEVSAGDSLISTSAIVLTRESQYQGATVRSGEQRVEFNLQGEVCHAGTCGMLCITLQKCCERLWHGV